MLTNNGTTKTYTKTRILDIKINHQPYTQTATVILANNDGTLNALDLQGYKGVISLGAITTDGDEYSAFPPLWVVPHQFNSTQTALTCQLDLIGIPNLLAEDRASGPYAPTTDDTDTVKDLIRQIAGDSGVTMMPVFNHCQPYDIVFDSEDSLIDVFQPQDGFRVYTNDSRMAKIRELLDDTKCVVRAEADGKLHIMVPVITGESYDYEYKLRVAGEHTFFSKAYRKRVVIPGYIECKSNTDDYPYYTGNAEDSGYSALPTELQIRQFINRRLASNAQATAIATAKLSKYQLHAELGALDAPMNVGEEVFDYVKVTDSRETDRTGNIGQINWHYNAKDNVWDMRFNFGGWLSVRQLGSDLDVYPDGVRENIKNLVIENLYAQFIYAEMMDVEYLSAITADIGLLTTGEIRIGTGILDPTGTATGGSQTTLDDSGQSWTPDEWIGEDLRVVIDGVAYTRAITDNTDTQLTINALPSGVAVSSGDSYYLGILAVASGDQYFIKSLGLQTTTGGSTTTLTDSGEGWTVDEHAGKPLYIIKNGYRYERVITSNTSDTLTFPVLPDYVPFTGFRIWWDSGNALGRMAGYTNGIIQYYTGSDGYLYAGAGAVVLNADGVQVNDSDALLKFNWSGSLVAQIGNSAGNLFKIAGATDKIVQIKGTPVRIEGDLDPNDDDTYKLGETTGTPKRWAEGHIRKGYFDTRLKIPVGTDMYD